MNCNAVTIHKAIKRNNKFLGYFWENKSPDDIWIKITTSENGGAADICKSVPINI